jgi:hypothetical protein
MTTPTLLLHGERDTTDTIGQSMMYSMMYSGPEGRDTEEIAWLMKYARAIDWKAPERTDAADAAAPKNTTDQ